jgi:hypothetical protein
VRWGSLGRCLRGWGILCAFAAVSGGARTHTAPRIPVAPATAAAAEATAPPAGGFRLGTAGRPFAWSTAIGDLNADGRPDFAIADRIGRRAAGFEYAIELSIAGGRSESVAFDSDQDALSVSLRDVDHDRDLDVVVTGTVSRSVVAIWLNDGTGQFHRAAPDTQPPTTWSASSSLTDSPFSDSQSGESIGQSAADGLAGDRVFEDLPLPVSTLVPCGAFRTARASLSSLRPRAPPPTPFSGDV